MGYLKEIGFLKDYEWNLARLLYFMTSDMGSHEIVGFKEYARISKNIVYELILLALTKMQ